MLLFIVFDNAAAKTPAANLTSSRTRTGNLWFPSVSSYAYFSEKQARERIERRGKVRIVSFSKNITYEINR